MLVPTYSYLCTMCEHAFDVRQSFTDDALTDCPECFDGRLRKVIHAVGISFKGSGFYKTDSRPSGGAAKSETKTESKTEAKSETKGHTKSETKSESKPVAKTETKSTSSPTPST